MKKTIKFVPAAMALAMCVSAMPISAFAVETQDGKLGNDNKVTVSMDIASNYTVKIPKSLTLDGGTQSSSYEVLVSGSIAGVEEIKVIPDATFVMSQHNKADVTATITQENQVVSASQVATGHKLPGTIEIKSKDATAGKWNGSFNFNISLDSLVRTFTYRDKNQITSIISDDTALSFEFLENMTWGEFLESEYNTAGFKTNSYNSNKVVTEHDGVSSFKNEAGEFVTVNDVITEQEYYLEKAYE